MCFGSMRNADKAKIIDDLDAEIFAKVLAFIHAEEKCLKINSMEEAWTLRWVLLFFVNPADPRGIT